MDFIHRKTIEDVTSHFPRQKWPSGFAAITREENGLRPWAYTTTLGEDELPGGTTSSWHGMAAGRGKIIFESFSIECPLVSIPRIEKPICTIRTLKVCAWMYRE